MLTIIIADKMTTKVTKKKRADVTDSCLTFGTMCRCVIKSHFGFCILQSYNPDIESLIHVFVEKSSHLRYFTLFFMSKVSKMSNNP